MRKKIGCGLLMVCMAVLTACGDSANDSKYSKGNSVDTVLENQVEKSDNADSDNADSDSNVEDSAKDDSVAGSSETASAVDYDLTEMGSDMVYSTVYQFMVNPEDYVGKTVRVRGQYYANWYEANQQYYHCVYIADAAACCAQGLEFVWEDGNHVYPDEYPEDESTIEVVGTFETYKEEGDDTLYCRLSNATLSENAE